MSGADSASGPGRCGSLVPGLQDPSTYPVLFAELLRRGWSEEELLKLAGRSHVRAMRQMEKVAAELQRTTPPSVAEGPRSPLDVL